MIKKRTIVSHERSYFANVRITEVETEDDIYWEYDKIGTSNKGIIGSKKDHGYTREKAIEWVAKNIK
jgi:hypothetical protein